MNFNGQTNFRQEEEEEMNQILNVSPLLINQEEVNLNTILPSSKRRRILVLNLQIYFLFMFVTSLLVPVPVARANPLTSHDDAREARKFTFYGSLSSSGDGIEVPADQIEALKAKLEAQYSSSTSGSNRGARASFLADSSSSGPHPHPISARRVSSGGNSGWNDDQLLHGMREARRGEEVAPIKDPKRISHDAGTISIPHAFRGARGGGHRARVNDDDEELLDDESEGSGAFGKNYDDDDEDDQEMEGSGSSSSSTRFDDDDEDRQTLNKVHPSNSKESKNNNSGDEQNKNRTKEDEEENKIQEVSSSSSSPQIVAPLMMTIISLTSLCCLMLNFRSI